jgi:CheY-like chemotaxis protein
MGGEIGVESAPGWGSTFWFTIPFEKTAASESGPLPVGPVLDGLRVLVVDGNRTSRTILQEQLTSAGILVSGADQVRRALELLHEGVAAGTAYEVVIIDRQLPGVDGLALARTIRAEPTFAATRIVLLDTPEDRGGMPTRRKGPGLDALAEVALRDGGSDAGHLVVRTRARRPTGGLVRPPAGRARRAPGSRGVELPCWPRSGHRWSRRWSAGRVRSTSSTP